MTNASKLDDLRARNTLALRATMTVLGLALLAILGALAHIETGAGPDFTDIHVPVTWLMGLDPSVLAPGEPYSVGNGMRKVVQWVVLLAFAGGQIFAVGLMFWALRKKQKQFILPAAFIFVMTDALSPVPKVIVAGTAQAVSVKTAERLLTAPSLEVQGRLVLRVTNVHEEQIKAYVRAQIVYLQGERSLARKASATINLDSLSSPIEAPYRLQFIQDRYQGLTTVCFTRFGCIKEHQRQWRFEAFIWIAGALALGGFVLLSISLLLTQRLTRVEALAAQATQIRTRKTA